MTEGGAGTSGGRWAGGSAGPLVILYDRDCAFCAWTAQLWGMDRHRRLEFVALQDAAASGRPMLLEAASQRPLTEALHVVDEERGEIIAGGRSMLAILDVLPGGRWFRPWLALPFIPPIVGAGYRLVARNRHRIGRWLGLDAARCVVPRNRWAA